MATVIQEEKIRTFEGVIIGIVETYDNGDQTARDFPSLRVLGHYKAAYNHTTDFYGRVIAKGNSVVSLIYTNKGK